MADIAAAAGVSVATVSKVLNDRPDVSRKTRALVQALLEQHQYVRTPRTKTGNEPAPRRPPGGGLIDIVFNDAGSPWAAEMISGVQSAARAARVSVVVSVLGPGNEDRRQWVQDVTDRGSQGVILVASLSAADRGRVSQLGVPFVSVDPVGDFDSDLLSFGVFNWGGAATATQHLLDLGHRRIGTVTGPMRYLCSQERLAGYRATLERAGIESDPALIRPGDFHFESAVRGATELLQLADPPTAIFAANDEQALGVYTAVQRQGLRVPEDLSVVGFDDVPMSQWVLPPLTTIRQPIRELAELATGALLQTAHNAPTAPTRARTELPTTLVVRSSTAPPRPRRTAKRP
nr:LacI family DNA-binding transcriptional regulator [Nakamurella panacisegetis]